MGKGSQSVRHAEIERETRETKIFVNLDLDVDRDGASAQNIRTGVDFFDHMLMQLAFHAPFDMGINAEGDLAIDDHHTIEDVGITLGLALKKALGSSAAIVRFASLHASMDDALVLVAVDVSGRGTLNFDLEFKRERIGGMSTECVREFCHAMAMNGGFNLHVIKVAGVNEHHVCEALFKGLGRVLYEATRVVERKGPSSTKGRMG